MRSSPVAVLAVSDEGLELVAQDRPLLRPSGAADLGDAEVGDLPGGGIARRGRRGPASSGGTLRDRDRDGEVVPAVAGIEQAVVAVLERAWEEDEQAARECRSATRWRRAETRIIGKSEPTPRSATTDDRRWRPALARAALDLVLHAALGTGRSAGLDEVGLGEVGGRGSDGRPSSAGTSWSGRAAIHG